jgi:methionyl-tRNA formyltransferase
LQKDLRIVFMGTPDFAVPTLDSLLQAGCKIVAVITAPDKPAGRGMKLTGSAVKNYAVTKQLPIVQPEKLKNPGFVEELRNFKPDLQVVVAFRMLPEVVWKMPPMGTINLHGSLLPQYRGAAPINWAIINGEKETGVTTFRLQHEIDTGNILLQEKISINDNETASELHNRMKMIGASLVVKTVNGLAEGSISEIPQEKVSPEQLKHAPKIFTETCKIDWTKNVDEIYNLIRGLSAYPGAFTFINNKLVKIFKAQKDSHPANVAPGTFETDGKHFLCFACADGFISVKEIQLEGKKKMSIEEFLRGYHQMLQSPM